MRQVECSYSWSEFENGDRKVMEKTVTGLFHGWGVDYEEFETGPGNYSVAIVELFDGTVATYPANRVKFLTGGGL